MDKNIRAHVRGNMGHQGAFSCTQAGGVVLAPASTMSHPPPSMPAGPVRMEYIDEDTTTPMPPRRHRMPPVLHAHLHQIAQMPPPNLQPDQQRPTFPSGRFDTTVKMARTIVRQALGARVEVRAVGRLAAFMALAILTGLTVALVIRERELRVQHAGHPPVVEATAPQSTAPAIAAQTTAKAAAEPTPPTATETIAPTTTAPAAPATKPAKRKSH